MYMEISLQQLYDWTSQAIEAGIQSYLKSMEPESDLINQTEAKKYIIRMGFKAVMLKKWSNEGLITKIKTGQSKNSSILYSLSEIKNLISSIKLKNICNIQKQ